MDLGFGISVHDGPPPREVLVYRDGEPAFAVRRHKGGARVFCPDVPDPELLEFLTASYDEFIDAGWTSGTWILTDCPVCGALPFHPCRSMSVPGRANRTVHHGRETGRRRLKATIIDV